MCVDEIVECLKDADYELKSCSSECSQYYDYLMQEKGLTSFSNNYCKVDKEGKISLV